LLQKRNKKDALGIAPWGSLLGGVDFSKVSNVRIRYFWGEDTAVFLGRFSYPPNILI
jgi:hypothetical protein